MACLLISFISRQPACGGPYTAGQLVLGISPGHPRRPDPDTAARSGQRSDPDTGGQIRTRWPDPDTAARSGHGGQIRTRRPDPDTVARPLHGASPSGPGEAHTRPRAVSLPVPRCRAVQTGAVVGGRSHPPGPDPPPPPLSVVGCHGRPLSD